jgi:DNA-binding MarR family transcriptional regulator
MEHSIGFNMGVTYRKLTNLLQYRLKEYDITPEQWSVLYQVARSEGLIQKDIAQRAGKDRPTTTRILDQLEGKGCIYKTTGENDRRSFLVHITDKGKELIDKTYPVEKQLIDDIKEWMTPVEYELLMELLLRINQRVSELTETE